MLTLRSTPIPIVWCPGATVVYDVASVYDLTSRVYNSMMAVYIAEEDRIAEAREAIVPDAPDAGEQHAALDAAAAANTEAGFQHLAAHLILSVEGITPTPVPGQPESWAHIPLVLKQWLIGPVVLGEVRSQITAPLPKLNPTG